MYFYKYIYIHSHIMIYIYIIIYIHTYNYIYTHIISLYNYIYTHIIELYIYIKTIYIYICIHIHPIIHPCGLGGPVRRKWQCPFWPRSLYRTGNMFLGWTTGLNQHGETWPRIGLYKMRPREYADILAEWLFGKTSSL